MAKTYTYQDHPEIIYLMYPDAKFVDSTGNKKTGMELFLEKYGTHTVSTQRRNTGALKQGISEAEYTGLPDYIKPFFKPAAGGIYVNERRYVFNNTIQNQTDAISAVQTYGSQYYTPEFIQSSKLPQYVKTQLTPTSPYYVGASTDNTSTTISDRSGSTNKYPSDAPANLPEPLTYNQFVETYFSNDSSGITTAQKKAEYEKYDTSFRNYVLSRTQYYDPESGTYKYIALPAWESVKMHRFLTVGDNGKPEVTYASSAARPVEDYTTYIDTSTGSLVEQPLRTRGEQQAQGWYITPDQLNNIIYDAENGAFKAPNTGVVPGASLPTLTHFSALDPTTKKTVARANAFLDPTHEDYQDVLALGQGPLTKEAATSWAQNASLLASPPTLAEFAASFRPGNTRIPTLFDLRK